MKNAPKKRVLILEDDDMVRLIVKDYLEVSGFEILESGDALSAIEMIKKNVCDIAIVDINIPQMSGESFITKAKQITPNIQVIIHTGSSDYKVNATMKAMGLSQNNVLVKPVEDMNMFIKIIQRLLDQ